MEGLSAPAQVSLSLLPLDVIAVIGSLLSWRDRVRLRGVCRSLLLGFDKRTAWRAEGVSCYAEFRERALRLTAYRKRRLRRNEKTLLELEGPLSMQEKRLAGELREIRARENGSCDISVEVVNDDLFRWRAHLSRRLAEGVEIVTVEALMSQKYPLHPPRIVAISPISHSHLGPIGEFSKRNSLFF